MTTIRITTACGGTIEIETGSDGPSSAVAAATKQDVEQHTITIMSRITEFATAVQAYQQQISAGISGLGADINGLKSKIAQLGECEGLSDEDNDLLDAVQAQAATLAEGITALDALTVPPLPPADPPTDDEPVDPPVDEDA